ncbi:Anaerobic nitric oxide reductase transcription regulator NorR [Elizabethkingia anophelis]|nr:Anaerobic nitric oxide reductase transcription regulator NorR [Elizabethkingia anophelis]CAI9671503.1 Anaerobic nitric oxide reductase transcription regulator NorR [Elizabethkingia anophelis]CAI9674476.1 Anaerobic nitric oxide reductase transcription regulator NorR [Elizabethkingia anophelis]CAI9681940.1 Anaerobic nitric oxide reductase transcription regulator NorR [Elizabethkingia anophelis]
MVVKPKIFNLIIKMSELQNIKARFGIIGNYPALNRALEKSMQVAPTDISVLVIGESGVGKEFIPKIIHSLSHRKHMPYIVVNCGAIPEGTIDSELFGHEKGAFTGATTTRKGYFEVADGGTIFLDEVGELPLQTQVRLLRVLESGEFMKVGSSVVQKTNVRIVAATNVNMMKAIQDGRFREDLYYRLNTVQIDMPPLRERKGDIHLLFRKFAIDFAEKYRMPEVYLTEDGVHYIENYSFPGNIRQLRNLVEQLTVVEQKREITSETLSHYIPMVSNAPMVITQPNQNSNSGGDFNNEREIMYKILFDMRSDINDLKTLTSELIKNRGASDLSNQEKTLINRIYTPEAQQAVVPNSLLYFENNNTPQNPTIISNNTEDNYEDIEDIELEEAKPESLSLQNNEKDLIIKALEKHKGRRNKAADELGISQRTLYRKIKQYNLED